jgi:hypothetical protein
VLQHAAAAPGEDMILRLSRTEDDTLWMEGQDAACGLPRMLAADTSSETGRGLFIVEYARCWGSRALADNAGKVVFAVIDRSRRLSERVGVVGLLLPLGAYCQ